MKIWNLIKKLFTRTPEVIDTGAKAVEVLSTLATAAAPLTGSNAPAVAAGATVANELAKKVDAAIPDKVEK